MNQVKLLDTIRVVHRWARGEASYIDIAWSLTIKQDSLLKLLLDNFLCYPGGQIMEGVGENEAVETILLALILQERHERQERKRQWLKRKR